MYTGGKRDTRERMKSAEEQDETERQEHSLVSGEKDTGLRKSFHSIV